MDQTQLPEHHVIISMFKVLVKLESIEAYYPNGWIGFAKNYEYDEEDRPPSGLVSLTSMSYQDVEHLASELNNNNLKSGEHFAIADQSAGVITPCEGIVFANHLDKDLSPFSFRIAYLPESTR